MKMNREEMLEYLKGFDQKPLAHLKEETVQATVNKMKDLLKKFGFEYHESFSMRCRDYSSKKKDTSWFYRYNIAEYEYIEVQLGYIEKQSKTYGYGKNKRTYPQGFEGLCRVFNIKVSLNPDTGKPWQVGDWDKSNPNYWRRLTKNGWWTGD